MAGGRAFWFGIAMTAMTGWGLAMAQDVESGDGAGRPVDGGQVLETGADTGPLTFALVVQDGDDQGTGEDVGPADAPAVRSSTALPDPDLGSKSDVGPEPGASSAMDPNTIDYWARYGERIPQALRTMCTNTTERDCLVRRQMSELPLHIVRGIQFEVRQVLARQVYAWNTGDIDGFMQGYWNSPDMRFVSGDTVILGYADALARYKRNYPDRASMDDLTFRELQIFPVSTEQTFVLGQWQLQRQDDSPNGRFLLHLELIDDGWVIVEDITE